MVFKKYISFLFLLLPLVVFHSCDQGSDNNNSNLMNTWIFNGKEFSSNKSGYIPTDDRYDKYKYMDLNNSGVGTLWGGAVILDGKVSWKEKEKWVELQAKNSGGLLLDVEKFDIDSLSSGYLHMTHQHSQNDTLIIKELFFKR